jgi:hypothetical protein
VFDIRVSTLNVRTVHMTCVKFLGSHAQKFASLEVVGPGTTLFIIWLVTPYSVAECTVSNSGSTYLVIKP